MVLSGNNTLAKTITPRTSGPETAVVVILNKNGKVLLVQEKTADQASGRKTGDWNLISETYKPRESLKENFIRAIKEELGIREEIVASLYLIRGSHREASYPFDSKTARARIFLLRFMGGDQDLPFRPIDSGEIADYRWVGIDEIKRFKSEDTLAPSVFDYLRQLNEQGMIKPYKLSEPLEELHLPAEKEAIRNV